MGILFTIPMGFLFTITMGILFTITIGIQLTIYMQALFAPVTHLDQGTGCPWHLEVPQKTIGTMPCPKF